jgi:hypothetical protein
MRADGEVGIGKWVGGNGDGDRARALEVVVGVRRECARIEAPMEGEKG